MSRSIKITDEMMEKIKAEFEAELAKARLSDDRFEFKSSKLSGAENKKAKLVFSEIAWVKQIALVNNFSDEVAWHGTAFRRKYEGMDGYYVEDIMVYPQEVTGVTVNTDEEEYTNWLAGLDDDRFTNLRFQGHSHVNMGVSASSTDENCQKNVINTLDDDDFYIFIIVNKNGDRNVTIYDIATNTVYENKDVVVAVETGDIDYLGFIETSKSMVKERKTSYQVTTSYSSKNKNSKQGTSKTKSNKPAYDDWDDDDESYYRDYYKRYYSGAYNY